MTSMVDTNSPACESHFKWRGLPYGLGTPFIFTCQFCSECIGIKFESATIEGAGLDQAVGCSVRHLRQDETLWFH